MKIDTSSMQATIDSVVNQCLEEEGLTWEAFANPGPVTPGHRRAWRKMRHTFPLLSIELLLSYKNIPRYRINYINQNL